MILAQILVNTSPLLYAFAIKVVYGFGIGLRGICEVTPYMEATTACRGILLMYYTYQCYITYIPWHGTFNLYLKSDTYLFVT